MNLFLIKRWTKFSIHCKGFTIYTLIIKLKKKVCTVPLDLLALSFIFLDYKLDIPSYTCTILSCHNLLIFLLSLIIHNCFLIIDDLSRFVHVFFLLKVVLCLCSFNQRHETRHLSNHFNLVCLFRCGLQTPDMLLHIGLGFPILGLQLRQSQKA